MKNLSPVWKTRKDRNDHEFEEIETTVGNVEISITRNEDYNLSAGFEKGSWDTTWFAKNSHSRSCYGGEVFQNVEDAKKYALGKVAEMEKKFSAKPKRTRRSKGPGISYSIYD